MLKISNKQVIFAMSPLNNPVASAKSGDTVQFETLDCFGNQIACESQLLCGINWDNINPATGPLYIEDAKAGDTLKVEILKIDIDKQAVMTNSPGHGVFGDKIHDEKTKVLPIENDCVKFNDKIALPICPMIGVIGTAPVSSAIETGSPGAHGGNMDCNQIIEGSTLYLPVNVDGALLAMGDLHAVMGDGEVSVCGAEIAGLVTVKVSVLKNAKFPLPFLTSNGCAMTLFSADTLDQAAAQATFAMQNLITDTLPLDFHDAGMLLSLTGNLRICQVVDPLVTCRMELPLWIWEKYGIIL